MYLVYGQIKKIPLLKHYLPLIYLIKRYFCVPFFTLLQVPELSCLLIALDQIMQMFDFRHWNLLQVSVSRRTQQHCFGFLCVGRYFMDYVKNSNNIVKSKILICFCFKGFFSNSVSNSGSQCVRYHCRMVSFYMIGYAFHRDKAIQDPFLPYTTALLSLFGDYVSQLKQLKGGYSICTAVLCLNLLLLQVWRDACKMRGHCCSARVQLLPGKYCSGCLCTACSAVGDCKEYFQLLESNIQEL